jgi:choloylglycine hydrolase
MSKRILLFLATAVSLLWIEPAFTCSNVFVTSKSGDRNPRIYAAVARTMDFAQLTGNSVGYGLRGVRNVSNINMYPPVNPATWTNQYSFAGQTSLRTSILNDGVNSQGLYAGMLELPGYTEYPVYNPSDPRPELGVMNVLSYVLGTSAHVTEALDRLQRHQIVINAGSVADVVFAGFPFHLSLRDQYGNSAVVEWIDGETHYYFHAAFSNAVIETIDSIDRPRTREYRVAHAAVLTNAPPYGWHLAEAERSPWADMVTGNTDQAWEVGGRSVFMNGSRLLGLPGDFTSPSRFIRGSVLARLMPRPTTQDQAMRAAYSIVQSLQQPAGSSPDPTIWVSWVDLKKGIYHFKPILSPLTFRVADDELAQLIDTPPMKDTPWRSVQVKSVTRVPPGGIAVKSALGKQVPASWQAEVLRSISAPTPGESTVEVRFE